MDGKSLEDRRIIVTGGSGGLGRAVAARMVSAGGRVLIVDRDENDLRRVVDKVAEMDGAGRIESFRADLSERSEIARMFDFADAWLGGIDILVACAGLGAGPLMEMRESDWRYVIESNLLSYVACTQASVERMRSGGGRDGLIILVGSVSVHIKAVGESVYNASKGGIALFAETLRKELIPDGIRVTLIEPGAIGSGMQPCSPEERARQIQEHKMLSPAEVADAILFAATRGPGVDVTTLRIEPLIQKMS